MKRLVLDQRFIEIKLLDRRFFTRKLYTLFRYLIYINKDLRRSLMVISVTCTYSFCYNFKTVNYRSKFYSSKIIWQKIFYQKALCCLSTFLVVIRLHHLKNLQKSIRLIKVTRTYTFSYNFETVSLRPKVHTNKMTWQKICYNKVLYCFCVLVTLIKLRNLKSVRRNL